ncbi:MAG: tripartite tricarboxylate transporter substrate binding protein [Thermodesulfobacteriota bacterium]
MKKRLVVDCVVRMTILLAAIGLLWHTASLTGHAASAKFPVKPILFVVPYSPGGGTDIMVRIIDKIGTQLKVFPQPLVIENKSGGSGVVGKSYAKTRPADGYTITAADDSSTVVDLFGNSPWPYNDFTYIAKLNVDYQMIVVRTESPYKTLKDLVAAAKAQPKAIRIGGTGVAQIDTLHVARLEKAAGIKFNYIGFDSGGQVMTNLLGGHVDCAIANPGEAYEQIRAGKVRSLGVSSDKRLGFDSPIFKEVPTWKEAGVDLSLSQWRGVAGPKGMAKEPTDWLIDAFRKITQSKDWQEQYLNKFLQVGVFVPGEELRKDAEEEYAVYKSIMESAGIVRKK